METDGEWATMSMTEAAAEIGVSLDKVRRWIDDAETAGRPVAERERDERGRPVPRSWRRPYRRAVAEWKARRRGQAGDVGGA